MIRRILKKGAAPMACGLLFFLLLRFVCFIGYVPSCSMEPIIPEGSFIVGMRIYSTPEYGDIVVFLHEGIPHVKRVAALPGDTVYIDEDTHQCHTKPQYGKNMRSIIVPEDSYYLLGDNSAESIDSRFWDNPFVLETDILAKVIFPS